jgi:protein-S-isoprenylcysteine O-methyltransferase Ste14
MTEKHKDSPAINKYVHPPIVAMFYIIVAILLGRFVPLVSELSIMIRNIGFGFVVVGFLFGLAAFLEFRKAKTTILPHGSASNIISSGIFRFTRNPIYLGFLFMVIGFPLNYGSIWGIVAALFFVTTMNRLVIEKEEAYLEKKFKEQYTSYKSSVRRWL